MDQEELEKESLGFEELGAKVKRKIGFVKLEVRGMVSFHQLNHNLIFSIMGLSAFMLIMTFGDC